MSANTISVPVIDLTDFPSERDKLAAASTALGCFRVINHGIPAEIQADMKSVVRSLFEISAEAKLRNVDVIPGSGYMAPTPKNPFYEAFGLYNAASSSDVHTDSGFLTVLQEDESVGGLEIMDSTGNFVAVDHVPGTFLVNLGDIAKVWSNGSLHNVKHRVQCREALPRISIALFMLAPKDGKVEPQQEFIDSEHPCLYQTFSFEEYRKLRLSPDAQVGEALSLFAADQSTLKA